MNATKRILLIDDEEQLCRLMKLNLERDGSYEVETAFSGSEGIEKATATPFDLVITDFRMPGMSGQEVINGLKAITPPAPVVICSVYHDDPETVTDRIRTQVDGVISKPIDHVQLHQTIREALAKGSRGSTA